MNKGIFTLMTAALLASGSVVTPAFADATFATYQAVNTNKVLANGVKFYLQVGSDEATSTQTDTKYYKAKKLTIKDKATVWSLEETLNADEASVFEVGNYTKVGGQYTFSLSVDGNKISLTKDGVIKSDAATTTEASKTVTTLITDKNKLSELNTFSASLMNATAVNVVLATQEEVMTAAMLNEYNTEGFTFGFNAKTDLEGNAFAKPMYAVEIGDDAATLDAGTYFVVGGKDDAVEALKKAVKAEEGVEEALATEDIQLLALNIDKKYDVRGAKSPAYILQVINGDKITGNKAAFSVKEFDKLANEGEYELKIEDPKQDKTVEGTEYVYVGAMRFTATDTKTYVTTVKEDEKPLLISATLGASTYLDASVLLKEGVANYVNVYFTSNKESEKDKFQTEYHKYLVPVPAVVKTGARAEETYTFAFDAKAAKDVNFKSALSQWAVKGFDGKYTFTLVNRETAQEITLGLQESDVKGEYKVVSAVDEDKEAVSFNTLKKAAPGEEGADEAKPVVNTTVKFIPVEKVAGFLDLSKDEMAAGIQLEFTGKTALIGEKTFFAMKKKEVAKTATEMLAPSMKASDAFTLAIDKAKGKIKEDDKDAVVNYTIQPLVLSCLKDGKIVELKDTLFVPTYNIYYTTPQEGKDDIVTYLGKDLKFATVSESEKPAEFVFRVNADGSYAMMGTEAAVSFDEDITANAKVVSVNSTTGNDFSTDEILLYNLSEGSFASVTVKVQDNSDKTTLPAEPRHASFDNILGSINYQLNKNGITEGILSAESMIFWLDTADSKATTPFFYISKGIEVAEGEEKPAERMFMYNATDSMSIFDENSAEASFNAKYELEGSSKNAKVIFRPATIAGVDTINTVVNGKAAVIASKANKADNVLAGLDNFKFGICLADPTVEGEYVIYSKADNSKYVYALNGKLGLGSREQAMVFTLGTEVPTGNESIDNATSSIVVTGNAGSVTIQGAQGETANVRNLLGMPLAETVVTSDNATIAVPAGIVLVTVGDETVKVVVK